MIILGIDPGTVSVGYALLEYDSTVRLHKAGLFSITSHSRRERLKELHMEMNRIIKMWRPDMVALERLFFAKNVKTALEVAEARGAILLTTSLAGLSIREYTPLEVKKTVTGDGNADKKQIQKMLKLTLKEVDAIDARDDVFDAIAVALTCHFKERNVTSSHRFF